MKIWLVSAGLLDRMGEDVLFLVTLTTTWQLDGVWYTVIAASTASAILTILFARR